MRNRSVSAYRRIGVSAFRNFGVSAIRLAVFVISVIALSKFFEAGSLSIFSLLIFTLTLLVMGYWIYAEEKEKNNLRIKFGLYEWFYKKKGIQK